MNGRRHFKIFDDQFYDEIDERKKVVGATEKSSYSSCTRKNIYIIAKMNKRHDKVVDDICEYVEKHEIKQMFQGSFV